MNDRSIRRGLTLVEMLVVIALVVTLTALAIPTVRILTRDVRVREAGRDLQAFLTDVQTAARAEGQAGIWLERDPVSPNTALQVFRVKTPPPYMGDLYESRCDVINDPTGILGPAGVFVDFLLTTNPNVSLYTAADPISGFFPDIQIDAKGPRYRISAVIGSFNRGGNTYHRVQLASYPHTTGSLPPGLSTNLPFKIFGQPTKQNLRQVTLPKQTYIDLGKSGFTPLDTTGDGLADTTGAELAVNANDTAPGPVIIMFGSDGSVESLLTKQLTKVFPAGQSLFLLLAMDERGQTGEFNPPLDVTAFPAYGTPGAYTTIDNLSNLWLVFGRNGRVTLADAGDPALRSSDSIGDVLRASRALALEQIQTSPN